MSLQKMSDLATTEMYKACSQGSKLGTAKLYVGRVENGKFMNFLTYQMSNAMISNISTSGGGGIPSDSPALDEDLQALLAPVPGPDPCGVSIRADALFTDIRLAREEDDPSLPMRQWERPLKKADWPRIEAACTEALCSRSKDLQLAAWLTESWTRQDAGIAGLARGLALLRELVVQHWDGVYPRRDPPQEGGDYEARVAVFEWLDGAMAHTLRVFVCLFPLAERKPQQLTLADWERLIAGELSGASPGSQPHESATGDSWRPCWTAWSGCWRRCAQPCLCASRGVAAQVRRAARSRRTCRATRMRRTTPTSGCSRSPRKGRWWWAPGSTATRPTGPWRRWPSTWQLSSPTAPRRI
jgi:hypothetical protein